jgi:hypothetical protein
MTMDNKNSEFTEQREESLEELLAFLKKLQDRSRLRK